MKLFPSECQRRSLLISQIGSDRHAISHCRSHSGPRLRSTYGVFSPLWVKYLLEVEQKRGDAKFWEQEIWRTEIGLLMQRLVDPNNATEINDPTSLSLAAPISEACDTDLISFTINHHCLPLAKWMGRWAIHTICIASVIIYIKYNYILAQYMYFFRFELPYANVYIRSLRLSLNRTF